MHVLLQPVSSGVCARATTAARQHHLGANGRNYSSAQWWRHTGTSSRAIRILLCPKFRGDFVLLQNCTHTSYVFWLCMHTIIVIHSKMPAGGHTNRDGEWRHPVEGDWAGCGRSGWQQPLHCPAHRPGWSCHGWVVSGTCYVIVQQCTRMIHWTGSGYKLISSEENIFSRHAY